MSDMIGYDAELQEHQLELRVKLPAVLASRLLASHDPARGVVGKGRRVGFKSTSAQDAKVICYSLAPDMLPAHMFVDGCVPQKKSTLKF